MAANDTIMKMFLDTAYFRESCPAYRWKLRPDDPVWTERNWKQYKENVFVVAEAFIKLGLDAKAGVAIIGDNSPQWILSLLGAQFCGAHAVGLYSTDSPEIMMYKMGISKTQILVVQNLSYLNKWKAIATGIDTVKKIILVEGSTDDPIVISWKELMVLGSAEEEIPSPALRQRITNTSANDVAALVFTSGTSGKPKAVMLSHFNIVWTTQSISAAFPMLNNERILSYLPLSHIAAQLIDVYLTAFVGAELWFSCSGDLSPPRRSNDGSIDRSRPLGLLSRMCECRPTFFLAVPKIWERIQSAMVAAAVSVKGISRTLSLWAKKLGAQYGNAIQVDPKAEKPWGWSVANDLVFSRVKKMLGLDCAKYLYSSAGPTSRSTLNFFLSLNMPIYEVYGMSECSGPATLTSPSFYRLGSVGKPICGSLVKVVSIAHGSSFRGRMLDSEHLLSVNTEGELCFKGGHIMRGYENDPDATTGTIIDGWLHSGDIGFIDSDGYIYITDRLKDIIITADSASIPPAPIEKEICSLKYISHCCLIGDRQKYTIALVTLNPIGLNQLQALSGVTIKSISRAGGSTELNDYIFTTITSNLKKLHNINNSHIPKKLVILPNVFESEGNDAELTATNELKRRVVMKKYEDIIRDVYGDDFVA